VVRRREDLREASALVRGRETDREGHADDPHRNGYQKHNLAAAGNTDTALCKSFAMLGPRQTDWLEHECDHLMRVLTYKRTHHFLMQDQQWHEDGNAQE
jgi:hypothetical protein